MEPAEHEAAVRRDERRRISAELENAAETIGKFTLDAESAVHMCAFLVSLGSKIDAQH